MSEQPQDEGILAHFTRGWESDDGRAFNAGWHIVDSDVAAEARERQVLDESGDTPPPADYADRWERQMAATGAAEERASRRRAARRKAAAKAEG